jgi:CheY-like chemotaxis protein/tRNA A-37 threonylcarbamoyl transferase component Bud32
MLPVADPVVAPTIGKYHLERELGRGGMGVVWEARDPQLQRRVAIKLMHALESESTSRLAQFEREAQAVARLQTPYVVHVYDYGVTADGRPYMVMELLEGESLGQRLQRSKLMTPAALLPLLTQLARAMDCAHEAGIIHRDLKPGNIFLARHGAEITVKVLDFGIATMHGSLQVGRTEQRMFAGTPPYMSPEQVRSDDVDHRTDLWALGVVMYEALTGRMPFQGDNLPGLVMRICMETHAPPSSLVPGLSPAIDAFFARALAKKPEDRFSSARELAAAFARAAPAEAVRATKILVVDDEPDLALLIEQLFDAQVAEGRYQFFFAGDGNGALQVLREQPDIDVALTDLRMPGMGGLTLLGKLGEVAPALRAIVISAFSDMHNIRQAMNSGAFDFLIKPLDFTDLESTIEKAGREVRQLRRALQSMEENESLRMFVDPAVRERLLPLLRVSGSLAGERNEVTVALVRIQGHHAPADDPRGAVEHLNRAFDDLMPVIDAYHGDVVRFLGDAALAVFRGERHNERAAAACIEVRDRLSLGQASVSAPCIGMAAGAVVTGSVGAPSRRRFDYAVFGEPVRLAHELESMARPGQILASSDLGQVLEDVFHCEPLGRQVLGADGQRREVIEVLSAREIAADDARTAGTMGLEDLTIPERKPDVIR